MASLTDKILSIGKRGTLTTLKAPGKALGATSLKVETWANWPTDTKVAFSIRRVYVGGPNDGEEVENSYTEWTGILSAGDGSIDSLVLQQGDDQEYPAGEGTEVMIDVSVTLWEHLKSALLTTLNLDGSLKDSIVTTAKLAANSVTANAINFASMTSHYKKLASNTSTTSVSAAVLSIPHGELVVGGKYEVTAVVVINAGATNSDGDFYIRHGTTVMTEGLSSGTYWDSIPLATQITYSSGGINLVGNSNGKTISAVGTTLVAHRVG